MILGHGLVQPRVLFLSSCFLYLLQAVRVNCTRPKHPGPIQEPQQSPTILGLRARSLVAEPLERPAESALRAPDKKGTGD